MKISPSFLIAVILELSPCLGATASSGRCQSSSSSSEQAVQEDGKDQLLESIDMKLSNLSLSLPGMASEGNSSLQSESLTFQKEYEIPADIQKKIMYCTELEDVEKLLSMVQEASIDQIVELMMASDFYLAKDSWIVEAVEKGYDYYIKYLIMAEYAYIDEDGVEKVISIALKEELVSNVAILLGYAYGKSWCPPKTWNRLASQFGICLFERDNVVLLQDALQDKSPNLDENVKKYLKAQFNERSLLEDITRWDAVEIFKFWHEQGKFTRLNFEPILKNKCMKILGYLSSKDFPPPEIKRLSLPVAYDWALVRAIETNNLRVIEYLLKSGYPSGYSCLQIKEYVSLDTLELLYGEENRQVAMQIKFKYLDLEGIRFYKEQIGRVPREVVLYSIAKYGYEELKTLVLENPYYVEDAKDEWVIWEELILAEFGFVQDVCNRYEFFPPTWVLRSAYNRGRLDIIEWWYDVRPEDVVKSCQWDGIMHAPIPVLNWIYSKYPNELDINKQSLFDAMLCDCYEFIQWANEKGFGMPTYVNLDKVKCRRDVQMLDWLKLKGFVYSKQDIKRGIALGNFLILEWAMKYSDLWPEEEFIEGLVNDRYGSKAQWEYFKAYYYHVKSGAIKKEPYGPTLPDSF